MKSKKMTLEQFADLLNAVEPWEWELDEILAIIVANGWIPIVDEWRLCHDGKQMIYFDDRGIAKITPIEL